MPRKGKVVAGITRIADFPFNPIMAIKLSYFCDHLVLGFDAQGGYGKSNGTDYIDGKTWYNLFKKVNPFPKSCTVDMFLTKATANPRVANDWSMSYLEELLRRLDDVKPDILLECEADACFSDGFEQELDEFIESGRHVWLMDAMSVSEGDRWVPEAVWCEHQRAAKWWPGITYNWPGGVGFCISKHEADPGERTVFRGKTVLWHFPFFTKKMEEERKRQYGDGTYNAMVNTTYDIRNAEYHPSHNIYGRKDAVTDKYSVKSCEIDPSNRCQNFCEFCYFKDKRDLSDMSLEMFVKITDELKNAGVQTITFTGGGEPLVNPEFSKMSMVAIEKGFRIGLITNGIALNGILDIASYFTFIRVSLDAATKETYEKIKHTDYFDTVLENIRKAVNKTDVGISFVVCKENVHEAENAYYLAKGLGVKYIQFKPDNKNHEFMVNVSGAINTKRYVPDSSEPCRAANQTGIVNPLGEVYYCCQKRNDENFKLGKLLEGRSFKEIWETRKELTPDISKCDVCRYMNYVIEPSSIQHKGFV